MLDCSIFEGFELPLHNERAMELLESVENLWEENHWLRGGPTSPEKVIHRTLSPSTLNSIIEFSTTNTAELEELLASEVCLDQLISIISAYAKS